MNQFEQAEAIRQWLVHAVGEDLRACGIAEEMVDLEVQTLANGVSFYLAQIQLERQELADDEVQCLQRLDPFQLLSDINRSPEYGA